MAEGSARLMDTPLLIVLVAMLGGAIRVSTPFMFVALGECLTEKSGRVNLGLEGTLVMGAMVGYAVSYHTGSPGWACSQRGWRVRCSAPCMARSAGCRRSTTSRSASP
jgi:hypothetical protein